MTGNSVAVVISAFRVRSRWESIQMIPSGPDRPPEMDVGDRVVARHSLGGFLRAKVSRGMAGVVVARDAAGGLRVSFSNGRILDVDPDDVALPDPRDGS